MASSVASVLVAALWVVGLALLWWRLEAPVVRLLDAIATRYVGIAPAPLPKQEPMPVDLLIALRSGESEGWASDDNVKLANELYAKYGDWDHVRAALG